MTLSLDEFLRRFRLHLLPKGFIRIRHFGSLPPKKTGGEKHATTFPGKAVSGAMVFQHPQLTPASPSLLKSRWEVSL